MEKICDELEVFLEGELAPAASSRFQEHLLRCGACQARMTESLEMDLRLDKVVHGPSVVLSKRAQQVLDAHPEKDKEKETDSAPPPVDDPAPPPPAQPLRPPRWARRVMGAGTALLAACATVVVLVQSRSVSPTVWLADERVRTMEARFGPPVADRYRPCEVNRSGVTPAAPPPAEQIARLEAKGDYTGIAAAYLVRGYFDEAEHYLNQAPPSAEVQNGLAALAFPRGRLEDALSHADQSLRLKPNNPQALWNRALAQRDLLLPGMAAASFRQVAALHEPGWSEDAESKAAELESEMAQRRTSWVDLEKAMRSVVENSLSLPADRWVDHRSLARRYFYEAVRAAPSPERVLALLPMAEALDRLDQDQVLTTYVRWAAARDFGQRRPLSEAYAQLALGQLPEAAHADFLARLQRSQEPDLLLGALALTRKASAFPEEYRKLAAATRDPWFAVRAEEVQAEAELNRGDAGRAESRLLAALSTCAASTRQELRCELSELKLAEVYDSLHRPQAARQRALEVLKRARQSNDWSLELAALQDLGQIAAHAGKLGLTHAYLEEVLAQIEPELRCSYEEVVRPALASVHQKALDFREARAQVDLLGRCGQTPSLPRLFAIADLARLLPRPEDAEVLRRGLEAQRKVASLGPGEVAFLDHIEGRFELERNLGLGRFLLRRAIAGADQAPKEDVLAQKARVYSYTSLLFDAGKRGEYPEALRLFSEELGIAPPARCALGVTAEDERTLAVIVDAGGQIRGAYDNQRKVPLQDVTTLIPAELVKALRSCEVVEVLARPPLTGQPMLLPPDLAWAYRVSQGKRITSTLPERRLVVTDIISPDELREKEALPRLDSALAVGSGADVVLREENATPSRVLQEMSTATEITFDTHGLSDAEVADASFLVLSKDADGRFRLTARDLQEGMLKGSPVVLLAACYAGQTTRFLHDAHGLPTAFIHAGARVVLASTEQIPDREAAAFFDSVLSGIHRGQPPAIALRDERQKWLQGHSDSWVKSVLLFE